MKKIILYLYIAIISWSCNVPSENPQENSVNTNEVIHLTDVQVNQLKIRVDSLRLGNFTQSISVKGKLELPPQNIISLSVPLGGYIQKIYPIQGQRISKGEPLIVLQDPVYIQLQQEYLSAQARLAFLSKDFERQKSLKEAQATSAKNFEELLMEYENQKILVKSLEKKLELLGIDIQKLNENTLSKQITVPSPLQGYVSSIFFNTGKYVQPSDIIMELIDDSDIHLVLKVYEKDISAIKIGQRVKVYANESPEKIFWAKIISIGKKINEDKMLEVDCHMEGSTEGLVVGTYMNAEIQGVSQQAYKVSSKAVVNFEGKHFIYVPLGENRYQRVKVKVLSEEQGNSYVELTEKIEKNSYVREGAYALLMVQENREE